MPASSLLKPRDFYAGEFYKLALSAYEGARMLKHNRFTNGELLHFDGLGQPLEMEVVSAEEIEGINLYITPPGMSDQPHSMMLQNSSPKPTERKGFLFAQPIQNGKSPEFNFTKHSAQIAEPEAPIGLAVKAAKKGYSQGYRYFATTWVISGGRHTELSELVKTPFIGNGQTIRVSIPQDAPEDVIGVGLWLTEAVPGPTDIPDSSTLRLQEVVDIKKYFAPVYDMTGPYRSGADARKPPTSNETITKKPSKPKVQLRRALNKLKKGKYRFRIRFLTNAGEGEPSDWTDIIEVASDEGQAFFVSPPDFVDDLIIGYRVETELDGEEYVSFDVDRAGGEESINPIPEDLVDEALDSIRPPASKPSRRGSGGRRHRDRRKGVFRIPTGEVQVNGITWDEIQSIDPDDEEIDEDDLLGRVIVGRKARVNKLPLKKRGDRKKRHKHVSKHKKKGKGKNRKNKNKNKGNNSQDESGIENPGSTDAPTVNTTDPVRPPAGTYRLGCTYVAGGRESPIGEQALVTIASDETIYVVFPNGVNLAPSPEFSEIAAPETTATDADETPFGWSITGTGGKWSAQAGYLIGDTQGSKAATKNIEWTAAREINRLSDVWFAGRIEMDTYSAGTFQIELVELSSTGTETVTVLASMASLGGYDWEVLYGPNGVAFATSTVTIKHRVRWIGGTRNGKGKVSRLLVCPMRCKPPRFEQASIGSYLPDDRSPAADITFPIGSAVTVGPPPTPLGFAPPAPSTGSVASPVVLGYKDFTADTLDAAPSTPTNFSHLRLLNGSATTDPEVITQVKNTTAFQYYGISKYWHVEDSTGSGDVDIIYRYLSPLTTRAQIAGQAIVRIVEDNEDYEMVLVHTGASSGIPAAVATKLARIHISNSQLVGSTFSPAGTATDYTLATITNNTYFAVEVRVKNAGTASAVAEFWVSKNGAAFGLAKTANFDASGKFARAVDIGGFNESTPGQDPHLDVGKITISETGAPVDTSSGTVTVATNPIARAQLPLDRPTQAVTPLATHGWETAEGGLAPTGWTRVAGGDTLVSSSTGVGQALRITGANPAGSLKRQFTGTTDRIAGQAEVFFRALPSSGTFGFFYLDPSSGTWIARALINSAGDLKVDVKDDAGTIQTVTLRTGVTASTSVQHIVELSATGVGTPAGQLTVWYARRSWPGGAYQQDKKIFRIFTGINWSAKSAGGVGITPTEGSAGATIDIEYDNVVVTSGGMSQFYDTFYPAARTIVSETLDFVDGDTTPGTWLADTVGSGALSVEAVSGSVLDPETLRLRALNTATSATNTARIYRTFANSETLGSRFSMFIGDLPSVDTPFCWISNAAFSSHLVQLSLTPEGEIIYTPLGGSEELVVSGLEIGDEVVVEAFVQGAGTTSGLPRVAVRFADDDQWYAQEIGTEGISPPNFSSATAGRITIGPSVASAAFDLSFDHIEVLTREQITPQTTGQIYGFFPKGSPVRDDVLLFMDPILVIPGVPFKFGFRLRYEGVEDPDDPEYQAYPATAYLFNEKGSRIDLSHLFTPVSGTSSGWVNYEMSASYTPPPGYLELQIQSKQIGGGAFVLQDFAFSEGEALLRDPYYEKYARLTTELDSWTPKAKLANRSDWPSLWRRVRDGVAQLPLGTMVMSVYRSADGDPDPVSWSEYEVDRLNLIPRRWLTIQEHLYGDGASSPLIVPGGPRLEYDKPGATLTYGDQTELPGGVVLDEVLPPTLRPDYASAWTEGGQLLVQPTTPPLGRQKPYTLNTFTEEGQQAAEETLVGRAIFYEARGRHLLHKYSDAPAMDEETGRAYKDEDGNTYHVWATGESPLAEVIEEGDLPPSEYY